MHLYFTWFYLLITKHATPSIIGKIKIRGKHIYQHGTLIEGEG
jgi:hypothetical protein